MSIITIKVGRRGQITLPSRVRRQLDIHEGDWLAVLSQPDHLEMRPITKTLLDLRGTVPVNGVQDFSAIRKEVISTRVRQEGHDEP